MTQAPLQKIGWSQPCDPMKNKQSPLWEVFCLKSKEIINLLISVNDWKMVTMCFFKNVLHIKEPDKTYRVLWHLSRLMQPKQKPVSTWLRFMCLLTFSFPLACLSWCAYMEFTNVRLLLITSEHVY